MARGGGFLRWAEVDEPGGSGHPFNTPVVRRLRETGRLSFDPAVTFLVGDNGSGKSTLLEGIAAAAGFNAEGGTTSFRFSSRPSAGAPEPWLRLVRGIGRPRTGFFLRAESYFNVATEIERLGVVGSYGGRSPHERSHGEAFLDLAVHRFGPHGLYLLDEPEAALSVHGCLALLARMDELSAAGSQFVVATHSPILLAVPDARILQLGEDGEISRVAYDDAQPVALTRSFLADPARFLRHLLVPPDQELDDF